MNMEAIAEAIFKVDYAGEPTYKTFSKLDPEDRQWYCDMAQAAVEAMGLTEEWGVWTDDGNDFIDPDGWITDDRPEAEAEAATKCLSCDHCRNALPKHVISRFVSPWASA